MSDNLTAANKVGGARVAENKSSSFNPKDQHEMQAIKDKVEGNCPTENKVNPSTFAPPPNPKVQSGVPNIQHSVGNQQHVKPGGANHG